jgi:hypothetical protein
MSDQEQKITTPQYVTAEQVLAYSGPEPLSEDFTDPESGFVYRIEGLRKFHAKIAAVAAAAELASRIKSGKIIVHDSAGDAFMPTEEEVEAAVFAARCVTQPKMGEIQWLATLGRSDTLSRLFYRILVCNRDLYGAGYDETVSEAKEALDSRPFSPTGTGSA